MLQATQLRASALARLCDLPNGPTEIGYGGARGGGKSHWLLVQVAIDDCQRRPGLKVLVLRKVGKANKENFEDLRTRLLGATPHRYTQQGHLLFPNGSQIILGHFKNEGDIDAYLGLEYDVIAIEEATTLSSSKVDAIRTCLRTSKLDWRPRMYFTTNPGGVGHTWFKDRFIVPFKRRNETTTRFVPATIDDNAFVNEEYKTEVLDKLVGWQYKAWRLGDWDIAAGQYFTNFRADVHVIPAYECPIEWDAWAALDYGFTHFTASHLFRKDGDGNVLITAEHGERKWLPEHHASSIHAMLGRHNLTVDRLETFVAGADVFAKRGYGLTIAETYDQYGITLSPANDDRVNGWGEMLTRFGDVEPGGGREPIEPKLFIFNTCVRLIEQIPTLEHNPHKPEDVLKIDCDERGRGGDDFADCARYGVMEAAHRGVVSSEPFVMSTPSSHLVAKPRSDHGSGFDNFGRFVPPPRRR
ncbi:large terminase subunit [Fimbriimonas ginsengisoli Gsoil 348]|uniref:Large terminase subunit n=1 Tax=Fimbriimonas ginsengisoli Gsoil 348 TaxID=661478 RepID=A0A068NL92_FIMGI|nr:large terminase subunit [Fimbriimonas ginsengisoli Gsoil 348]